MLYHQTRHTKDLLTVFFSLCCRFQNSKFKLVEDDQKFTSHTSTSTTQGETSLSIAWCRGKWTQSSDFFIPCCELLANLQSNISGSNRLPIGRSNPTLQACKRHPNNSFSSTDLFCKDFSGWAMSDSSLAIHFPFLQLQSGISAEVIKLFYIWKAFWRNSIFLES